MSALESPDVRPRVLVVMGVSGSGKSSIALRLRDELGWPFQEGDELHPKENVAKMAEGIPLTDEDRGPWLDICARWIRERLEAGTGGLLTCSALRRIYRERLGAGLPDLYFLYLKVPEDVLRSSARAKAWALHATLSAAEPVAYSGGACCRRAGACRAGGADRRPDRGGRDHGAAASRQAGQLGGSLASDQSPSDGTRIFVDADACPVKDEVYRVAMRYGVRVFVVSNSMINLPVLPLVERVVVESGPDVADDWIAERAGCAGCGW